MISKEIKRMIFLFFMAQISIAVKIGCETCGHQTNKKMEPPIMIYGGMGSYCTDPAYKNLLKKLQEGLNTHVECYETTI